MAHEAPQIPPEETRCSPHFEVGRRFLCDLETLLRWVERHVERAVQEEHRSRIAFQPFRRLTASRKALPSPFGAWKAARCST